MPDLAALRRNSARLAFVYAGAAFTAYYRPADVGDRTFRAEAAIRAGDMGALYAELGELVGSWDATDGGAAIPTTAAGFRSAGVGVCLALWNALLPDIANPTMAPSPAGAPTPSPSGSPATDGSAPAPTTTPSSATPNGSGSHPGSWPASPEPLATPAGWPGATA